MDCQGQSRRMLGALAIGVGLIAQSFIVATASAQLKPNVVFILADNVGYGDLGPYGGGEGLLKVGLPAAKERLSEKDPTIAELLKPQGPLPPLASAAVSQFTKEI